ncbi:MAG: DUF3144 domain-containing protein [Methylotenera sp.]|uniref:DUF3144 domain-containing protein n=1 Tax=Methylotenera sp. TaxID=2051956 RepID=UPI0017CEE7B1|nr:DUF3144 domain-containing protein [Methylotenera sp.]NOU25128.1 DUF3144 domain-containing protein [Methylotenera sp.]
MADTKQAEENAGDDAAFWSLTDKFIGFANEQATSNDVSVVNASFAFASARFNTFLIASQCGTKENFEAEKDVALEYFVNQYKIALTEHMADYQAKFDTYIKTA